MISTFSTLKTFAAETTPALTVLAGMLKGSGFGRDGIAEIKITRHNDGAFSANVTYGNGEIDAYTCGSHYGATWFQTVGQSARLKALKKAVHAKHLAAA